MLVVVRGRPSTVTTPFTALKMLRPSGFDDDNILWVRNKPFASAYGERSYRMTGAATDLREALRLGRLLLDDPQRVTLV